MEGGEHLSCKEDKQTWIRYGYDVNIMPVTSSLIQHQETT